jgi:uncharacterized phage-associated protein
MAYDGRFVANYFLELVKADGEKITPMKLQKYEPLIAEGFQAWKHGPVSADVYSAFRSNKWFPIR